MDDVVAGVIHKAIEAMRLHSIPVHTFALYFDHETPAISACIDTAVNSQRTVQGINHYNQQHFRAAVEAGDLKGAALWNANVGRNLSLGDFAFVNVARVELPTPPANGTVFLAMVRELIANESAIAAFAPDRDTLLFCSSGPNDEVEFVWSPGTGPVAQHA